MNREPICWWIDESDPGPVEIDPVTAIQSMFTAFTTKVVETYTPVITSISEYFNMAFSTTPTEFRLIPEKPTKTHGPRSGKQFDLKGNRRW